MSLKNKLSETNLSNFSSENGDKETDRIHTVAGRNYYPHKTKTNSYSIFP